jgi:hypothetical protein
MREGTGFSQFVVLNDSVYRLVHLEALINVKTHYRVFVWVVCWCFQENLGNTRCEVEQLRGQLSACWHTTAQVVSELRTELARMRALIQQEQVEFNGLQAQLLAALGQRYDSAVEAEKMLRQEQLQRLTVDHELEMDSLKKDVRSAAEAKDEEIRILKQVRCGNTLLFNSLLSNYLSGISLKVLTVLVPEPSIVHYP